MRSLQERVADKRQGLESLEKLCQEAHETALGRDAAVAKLKAQAAPAQLKAGERASVRLQFKSDQATAAAQVCHQPRLTMRAREQSNKY